MNATQRLIDCMEALLEKFENDGCVYTEEALSGEEHDYMTAALAAAKEEQGRVLTDEEIERRAYGRTDDPVMAAGYMMAIRDMQYNGYIAPANGLDVEGVMSLVNEHLFGINTSTNDDVVCSVMGQDALRKALEAYAENRSGNLRSNPLTPNSVVDQKGDDVNS